MKKNRNYVLIAVLMFFAVVLVPWGDIYESIFNTARTEEDIVRIATRELKPHEGDEVEIIDTFTYNGNTKAAVWVQYGNKVALIDFDRNWGEGFVFNKIAKPIIRGDGCYSVPLFPDGYAFLCTNEKIAVFYINGEEIPVEKVPFVCFHDDRIPAHETTGYTTTTEYYFLDRDGNELQ
ncbi:MAG: hypothetical protein IKM61_04750 [Eubacteriaceae bacterium]|nr:hypothetical protein [Eubacteriaceae bacterium]